MTDLISRQAAIDALAEWHDAAITNRLNNLPTVDAVPVRHGHWIIGDDGALHCSECSRISVNRIIVDEIRIFDMTPIKERMKYCPNCGAKMDMKEDGSYEQRDEKAQKGAGAGAPEAEDQGDGAQL